MSGLKEFFLKILGTTARQERAKKLKELSESIEKETRMHEELLRILSYPEAEIAREEFDYLPDSASIDPATCPIGTWFVYPRFEAAPDISVIGHVVLNDDLLNSQWGGFALGLPKQAANRYRVRIIERV